MTRSELLVAAVQAKGSDARDPRDAAHEACHALRWKVAKRWTRDNIHAKAPKRPAEKLREEIIARAAEALVCAELGIEHDLDKWVLLCVMEQVRMEGIAVPSFDWLKKAIQERMGSTEAKGDAADVLALAAGPIAKRKKTERIETGGTP